MSSFISWVFSVLDFTQKKQHFLWFRTQLDPFWGSWDNNSSKQRPIELKFWPQVILIAAQMLFKAFWKIRIFAETVRTQSLNFWSNFHPKFTPWRWPESKIAMALSKSVKIKALSSFDFQWKLYLLLALFGFFLGTNRSKVKDKEVAA